MNLYIRYFDDEVVVTNIEDALAFIRGIQDFNYTAQFESDFREYVESSVPFPKRYKVRPRIYFIVIKTTAATLEEFKANGKSAEHSVQDDSIKASPIIPRDMGRQRLTDELPGWYEGTLFFKRVVVVPQTGKYDYRDTTFSALVKAYSPMDCYNRIVDHLKSREDVDDRSQFPSPKGKNFQFTYIGLKPLSELNV